MVKNLNKNKPNPQKIKKANMIVVANDEILLSSRMYNEYKSLAEKVFNDAMASNSGDVWELVESLDPDTVSNRNRNVLVLSEHVSCLIVIVIVIVIVTVFVTVTVIVIVIVFVTVTVTVTVIVMVIVIKYTRTYI
jgi:type IV secretory pathway VirB6-like protein